MRGAEVVLQVELLDSRRHHDSEKGSAVKTLSRGDVDGPSPEAGFLRPSSDIEQSCASRGFCPGSNLSNPNLVEYASHLVDHATALPSQFTQKPPAHNCVLWRRKLFIELN